MTWTVRDIERDRETIDAIEGHDDCAAAIKASAYLEDRLTTTLEAHDIRPPSSFRQKIDTATRKGILSDHLASPLHTIREIRNEFAHSLSGLTFNSPSIVKFSENLMSIEQIRGLRASTVECFPDCHDLVRAVSVLVAPMLELPETPRNTYMNAVKLMLFFIELLKASAIMGDGDRLEILPEMKIF